MSPGCVIARGLAIAGAAVVAACAPISVTSFTERNVDVAAFRTFAWHDVDTSMPGDPRLDNNPFFHEYLRDAIERELMTRGYEHTGLQPELYVHYHAVAQQKVVERGGESRRAPCRDCGVEIYDEGTILVDLTQARTGALVWRGVAVSDLAAAVNSQTRMERTIDRLVERIFARLPRRS